MGNIKPEKAEPEKPMSKEHKIIIIMKSIKTTLLLILILLSPISFSQVVYSIQMVEQPNSLISNDNCVIDTILTDGQFGIPVGYNFFYDTQNHDDFVFVYKQNGNVIVSTYNKTNEQITEKFNFGGGTPKFFQRLNDQDYLLTYIDINTNFQSYRISANLTDSTLMNGSFNPNSTSLNNGPFHQFDNKLLIFDGDLRIFNLTSGALMQPIPNSSASSQFYGYTVSGYGCALKYDNDNALLLYRRINASISNILYYIVKYNFSSAQYQILDSIDQNSQWYNNFGGDYGVGVYFNYAGNDKLIMTNKYYGPAGLGMISTYGLNSHIVELQKNFTSLNEQIQRPFNVGNLIISPQHIGLVDGNGTYVNQCSSVVHADDLFRLRRCPEAQNANAVAGLDSKNLIDDLTIFPNPTKDHFLLRYSNLAVSKEIKLYSLAGKLIQSISLTNLNISENEIKIDISSFESGVYFVEINGDFEKIIVE